MAQHDLTKRHAGRLDRSNSFRVWKELVLRDLKLRYEGALLGYMWTIFEPVLLTGIYYVVFGLVGRFGIEDYTIFLVVGILPWLWFNGVANSAASSLTTRGGLFGKIYLRRELAPMSVVGAKSAEYLASIPVVLVLVLFAGRAPTWQILFLPLAWLIQLATMIGVAFFVSATNAIARDVERFLRPLMRALFYATPILYPTVLAEDRFPDLLVPILRFNPLVGPMELYRYGFYPQLFAGWDYVLSSLATSLVVLGVGYMTFRRLEPTVLKEL